MANNSKIYTYIIKSIIEFFDKHTLKDPQKYFYKLETEKQILELEKELNSNKDISVMKLEHLQIKSDYYAFVNEKNKLIFSIALEGKTSNDFLVTLRNIVGSGDYSDYSIIMFFKGELDSISRGTKSLSSNEMPLNVDYVMARLKEQMKREVISKKDLKVLEVLFEYTNSDFYEVNESVFDLEIFLDIIVKKVIEDKDYFGFGLFPYDCHEDAKVKDIRSDINDNAMKFEKIHQGHSMGNFDKINTDYAGGTKELLKKDEWFKTHYGKVKQSFENAKENSKIEYYPIGGDGLKSHTEENLTMLDIPEKQTTVGRRTRNIIVFNDKNSTNHAFTFKFSKFTKKEFIVKGSDIAKSNGKGIKVNIDETNFNQLKEVIYRHEGKRFVFKIVVLPISISYLEDIDLLNLSINSSKEFLEEIRFDYITNSEKLVIGNSVDGIEEYEATLGEVKVYNGKKYSINLETEEIDTHCIIKFTDTSYSFAINVIVEEKDKKIAIRAKDIISMKIQNKQSFAKVQEGTLKIELTNYELNDKKLVNMIDYEFEILNNGSLTLELGQDGLQDTSKNIEIPSEIKKGYNIILDLFKEYSNIPLLMFWSEEILIRIDEYINLFFGYIESCSGQAKL